MQQRLVILTKRLELRVSTQSDEKVSYRVEPKSPKLILKQNDSVTYH